MSAHHSSTNVRLLPLTAIEFQQRGFNLLTRLNDVFLIVGMQRAAFSRGAHHSVRSVLRECCK